MWLQVHAHEELVEADFQRFYQLDYRDVYRPGGGASRLTLRRALSLAMLLPPESLFKSELEDRHPISIETAALYQLWEIQTGKKSPNWNLRRDQRRIAEHKQAVHAASARAAEHNAAFLARRRKNLGG
ncbi:hypothetical protein [Corynebacterium vitaeruminis]|uniref:hypothetical protein n=1 Tax=Corynebacterium vitaeruminis TaxID=38305 RepID=UPI0023F4C2F4|nr:hypothetical protein [Corynebacterium vitaeruminis]